MCLYINVFNTFPHVAIPAGLKKSARVMLQRTLKITDKNTQIMEQTKTQITRKPGNRKPFPATALIEKLNCLEPQSFYPPSMEVKTRKCLHCEKKISSAWKRNWQAVRRGGLLRGRSKGHVASWQKISRSLCLTEAT